LGKWCKKIKSGGAKSKKYKIISEIFIISRCAPAPLSAAPPLVIYNIMVIDFVIIIYIYRGCFK
jgi:hypothetical protein